MIQSALASSVTAEIGWTLLHFLWQGLLLAALLELALAMTRSAAARHNLALATLLLMAAAPVVTFLFLHVPQGLPPQDNSSAVAFAVPGDITVAAPTAIPASPVPAATAAAMPQPSMPWPWMSWLVLCWFGGMAGLSLRALAGWWMVESLRRRDVMAMPPELLARCHALAQQLAVKHSIRFLQSARVSVPVVIGWFRPVILVPAAAIAGLAPQQLEALIQHELAHIRRHDALINLVQLAVETLLFYHPAVWHVSRRIRIERENCCDDLAVSGCGDAVLYVEALTALEAGRLPPGLVLASHGGGLRDRVARLLGVPQQTRRYSLPALTGLLFTVLVAGTVALAQPGTKLKQAVPAVAALEKAIQLAQATLPASAGTAAPGATDKSQDIRITADRTSNPSIRGERDVTDLGILTQAALPKSAIKVSTFNGNVVLAGNAANALEATRAVNLAAAWAGDPKKVVNNLSVAGGEQVMLKLRIAEMRRSDARQFGVNAGGVPVISATKNVQEVLDGLERAGLVHMLADAHLAAVTGETAKFRSGGEFPIPTGRDRDGNITLEFKPFGVGLSFTPVVMSPERISIQLSTEVSELFNTGATNVSGVSVVRRTETSVELPSGGSFAIAGLLQRNIKQANAGLPGAKDMPVLGALFHSPDFQNDETEVVVLVSVNLVRPNPGSNSSPPVKEGALPMPLKLAQAAPAPSIERIAQLAASGNAVAQYRLGELYERGEGVPYDPRTATRWYQAAADQGNRLAMYKLAVVLANRSLGQPNMPEAARWFARAAGLGVSDAQFNLAVLYERGDGVPQSLIDAYKWYSIAGTAGDNGARERAEVLGGQLPETDRTAAQRSAAAFRAQPLARAANVLPGEPE